jgi:hypothetical protein
MIEQSPEIVQRQFERKIAGPSGNDQRQHVGGRTDKADPFDPVMLPLYDACQKRHGELQKPAHEYNGKAGPKKILPVFLELFHYKLQTGPGVCMISDLVIDQQQ